MKFVNIYWIELTIYVYADADVFDESKLEDLKKEDVLTKNELRECNLQKTEVHLQKLS